MKPSTPQIKWQGVFLISCFLGCLFFKTAYNSSFAPFLHPDDFDSTFAAFRYRYSLFGR